MERFQIGISPCESGYKTLVSSYPYTCCKHTHLPTPLFTYNIRLNTGLSGNGGFISFLSITAQCSHGAPKQRSETVAASFCRKTQRCGRVYGTDLLKKNLSILQYIYGRYSISYSRFYVYAVANIILKCLTAYITKNAKPQASKLFSS